MRSLRRSIALILTALVLSGCTMLGGEQQSTAPLAIPSVAAGAAASATPATSRFNLVQVLTHTPVPTPRLTATPEPPPPVEPVRVAAQGFAQERQQVTVAFVLENPNADIVFSRLTVRIILQDGAGGALLAHQQGVEVLWPGERLGSVQAMSLPPETRAGGVMVEIVAARSARQPARPLFTTEGVSYAAGKSAGRVTGRVLNPHDTAIDKLRLVAVAYDSAGAVIGGGAAVLNHLPAKGAGAADVPVKTAVPPARVELFATLTAASKVN